jgi:hypothetical protein
VTGNMSDKINEIKIENVLDTFYGALDTSNILSNEDRRKLEESKKREKYFLDADKIIGTLEFSKETKDVLEKEKIRLFRDLFEQQFVDTNKTNLLKFLLKDIKQNKTNSLQKYVTNKKVDLNNEVVFFSNEVFWIIRSKDMMLMDLKKATQERFKKYRQSLGENWSLFTYGILPIFLMKFTADFKIMKEDIKYSKKLYENFFFIYNDELKLDYIDNGSCFPLGNRASEGRSRSASGSLKSFSLQDFYLETIVSDKYKHMYDPSTSLTVLAVKIKAKSLVKPAGPQAGIENASDSKVFMDVNEPVAFSLGSIFVNVAKKDTQDSRAFLKTNQKVKNYNGKKGIEFSYVIVEIPFNYYLSFELLVLKDSKTHQQLQNLFGQK